MDKMNSFLEGYMQRVGYEGPARPDLETLRALHELHPAAIPFENLNPYCRLPVLLDNESIYQKLVEGRRGGYCFEQNLLLDRVLRELGFNVQGLAARVRWNQPEGTVQARGHMLLLITLGGQRYIADVGFGGLTLTAPLLLEPGLEQSTPHERFRLLPEGDEFQLQALIKGQWQSVYQFSLQPQLLPDYEVSNWYLSNYPQSHFLAGILVARSVPGRRLTLRNNQLSEHRLNGGTEKRIIENGAELKAVLENVFGLDLTGLPDLKERLAALIAGLQTERSPEVAS